jgi:hypothetical protein
MPKFIYNEITTYEIEAESQEAADYLMASATHEFEVLNVDNFRVDPKTDEQTLIDH